MASSISLRRMASPSLLKSFLNPNPIRPLSVAPSVWRSFNTSVQVSRHDGETSDDIDRRSDRSVPRRREIDFFSGVFDPFYPSRSLSQVMNLVDQLMDNPFLAASRGIGAGSASRKSWDVKEDENALFLRLDMPGLGKEDVKVSVEQSTLTIKGEGKPASAEEEESGQKYSRRIDLSPKLYQLDQIKAEMKNGVLKVVVPKVKEDKMIEVLLIEVD